MVGPIRTLEDLARKGFDVNATCLSCRYTRTIPIAEVRRLFRERRRPESWRGAEKRWRCSWCGHRGDVELRAFLAAPAGALEVLREAVMIANRQPVQTYDVRQALDALEPVLSDAAEAEAFWQAAGLMDGPAAGRAASLGHHLIRLERQLGRHNDDAPLRIEQKFGRRYPAGDEPG
jgi:hypothetical protein